MRQTDIQNAILLVLILNLVLPGPNRSDFSLLPVPFKVYILASVPVLWAGGLCGTSCSNVNTGANIFICINANALALYLKSKNQNSVLPHGRDDVRHSTEIF